MITYVYIYIYIQNYTTYDYLIIYNYIHTWLRWVWVDWNDSFLTHFLKLRTNPPSTACFLQICLNQGPEDSQMCRKMLATYIGTGALLCQGRWTLHNNYVDWLDLARLTILLGPRPLLDQTGVCQRFNLKFSRWTKVFPKKLSRSTPRRPELYHTRESASHLVLSLSHMGLSGTWLLQNPINGSCLTIANILAMVVIYIFIPCYISMISPIKMCGFTNQTHPFCPPLHVPRYCSLRVGVHAGLSRTACEMSGSPATGVPWWMWSGNAEMVDLPWIYPLYHHDMPSIWPFLLWTAAIRQVFLNVVIRKCRCRDLGSPRSRTF